MKSSLVLHIGLPKTGTSLLQTRLFARHGGVGFFGKHPEREPGPVMRDAETEEVYEQLAGQRMFETDLARCRRWYQTQVVREIDAGRVPVVSYEAIARGSAERLRRRAENFREACGPCRVMVTLRNPLKLVESMYFQNLKSRCLGAMSGFGKTPKFVPMEHWLDAAWNRPEHGALALLNYPACVEVFADVFGADNVRVFLYEDLAADSPGYIRSVCEFLGIDGDEGLRLADGQSENVRWTSDAVTRFQAISASPLKRNLYRFAPVGLRQRMLGLTGTARSSTGNRARAVLPDAWAERITDYTRDGNRAIARRFGLPLERHAYPV
jgi:hypothetical protein